ncbi:MAG: Gfo/Idh/MocA family oxidoreductase [Planctomycetaceae bacterium]|nr:Gfo/Idh/MocA family oxidoreductase [Planctomycetaceae bacterium]
MAKIKYGQVGVGHPHASKISAYRESDEWDVVGVVEPDDQLRAKAQQQDAYRDVNWMTFEELLNVPDLQVVGVETKVAGLLDVAEQCIAADKHIHLDKPAGNDLALYRRILDEAARKHLAVQMGYMYRYNPGVVMLRDFLSRGWMGQPFELHAVMSKKMDASARQGMLQYIGGTMFDLGGHLIDLVVGFLGEPVKVHPFVQHSSPIDDGLRDNMLAVFEYPQATATIRTSLNEVEGFARRHLTLCGTEGTFHMQPLDDPEAKVAFSQPHGKYQKGYQDVTLPKYRRYVADVADLAQIVRGEKDANFSYEHDYAVQKSLFLACGLPVDGRA